MDTLAVLLGQKLQVDDDDDVKNDDNLDSNNNGDDDDVNVSVNTRSIIYFFLMYTLSKNILHAIELFYKNP